MTFTREQAFWVIRLLAEAWRDTKISAPTFDVLLSYILERIKD